MQPKPAKSRQESGARTPSKGKSATDSEELYGDECGNEPPIRRRISHPSNTSPHSGGENSVKALKACNRIRDATASAINEGNVKKKLKIPHNRDTQEEGASKSSQDGSGEPIQRQTLRRNRRKYFGTSQGFTEAKERVDYSKWVQASNKEGNALEAQETFDRAEMPSGKEVNQSQ